MGDINKKNEDSRMFFEFILDNGFKPDNYRNILELVQSVPNSISQYLKNYHQFLLSEKVKYSQLDEYNIKGAQGYIYADSGIIVPKSIEADEYFQNRKPKVHGYIYPDISQFTSALAYHDWNIEDLNQIKLLSYYSKLDCYIGCLISIDDEKLERKINFYQNLVEYLESCTSKKYKIEMDRVSEKNKELYLINRKDKELFFVNNNYII